LAFKPAVINLGIDHYLSMGGDG